jgi:hypothetical protein
MKQATAITCVFLDVGSVVLTDGWDHLTRKRAANSTCTKLASFGLQTEGHA